MWSNGGVKSRTSPSWLANQLLIHSRHRPRRASRFRRAADDSPGLRDRIDPAFRIWRSPAACHRRNTRGDTNRHPILRARAPLSSALTCSRQVSARLRSPRASAILANSHRTVCRNQPSQTLSPLPLAHAIHPVIPVACAHQRKAVAPTSRLRSRARAQCSNRVARYRRRAARSTIRFALRQRRRLQETEPLLPARPCRRWLR